MKMAFGHGKSRKAMACLLACARILGDFERNARVFWHYTSPTQLIIAKIKYTRWTKRALLRRPTNI
jgi:hypothetical protein